MSYTLDTVRTTLTLEGWSSVASCFDFFFQAEDGIRDVAVTGVQTCALPIFNDTFDNTNRLTQIAQGTTTVGFTYDNANRRATLILPNGVVTSYSYDTASQLTGMKIGRASCRGRV